MLETENPEGSPWDFLFLRNVSQNTTGTSLPRQAKRLIIVGK